MTDTGPDTVTVADSLKESCLLLQRVNSYVKDCKGVNTSSEPGKSIEKAYFALCHQLAEEALYYLERALEKMRLRVKEDHD